MRQQSLAELLGYPPDTRLLIVNADDFGMCHAENAATIDGLDRGAFCSATVMVPCPWFNDVVAYARSNPAADVGVHITHTSEWEGYKWGPVAGPGSVPSLVDARGYFPPDVAGLYTRACLEEIERETRAQIDGALAAGIDVTHLDSHMGTVMLAPAYHALYVRLAAEYRLPIRMSARAHVEAMGMGDVITLADRLGVLAPDYLWLGGPARPQDTERYWTALLRRLKPGVNELYVHAALDTPELRAITGDWAQRPADHAFFTAPSTESLLRELSIVRVGYRAIRDLQRQLLVC